MPVTGQDTILVADAFDLSPFSMQSDISFDQALHDVTTYGNDWRRFLPGLKGATMSFGGFAEEDLDEQVFEDFNGGAGVWVTYARTRDVGAPCFVLQPKYGSVSFVNPVDGLVGCNGALTASGDETSLGRLQTPGKATSSGSGAAVTFNGGGVDNGVATTDGGFAVLHLTEFTRASGNPTVSFRIQHRNATNTAWVDKATLTPAPTAAGVYRLALTGAINRYTRAVIVFGANFTTARYVVSLVRS